LFDVYANKMNKIVQELTITRSFSIETHVSFNTPNKERDNAT